MWKGCRLDFQPEGCAWCSSAVARQCGERGEFSGWPVAARTTHLALPYYIIDPERLSSRRSPDSISSLSNRAFVAPTAQPTRATQAISYPLSKHQQRSQDASIPSTRRILPVPLNGHCPMRSSPVLHIPAFGCYSIVS
jgi:hypothetical protein